MIYRVPTGKMLMATFIVVLFSYLFGGNTIELWLVQWAVPAYDSAKAEGLLTIMALLYGGRKATEAAKVVGVSVAQSKKQT